MMGLYRDYSTHLRDIRRALPSLRSDLRLGVGAQTSHKSH